MMARLLGAPLGALLFCTLALPILQPSQQQEFDLLQLASSIRESLDGNAMEAMDSLPPNLLSFFQERASDEKASLLYEMVPGLNNSASADMEPFKAAAQKSIINIITKIIKLIEALLKLHLDPLYLGNFAKNLTLNDLKGSVNLQGLYLSNLLETRVVRYDVNLLNLCAEADILMPDIVLSGLYDVEAAVTIGGSTTNVYGNGPMRAEVSTIDFHGALCLRFPSKHVALKAEHFSLSVAKTQINLANLLGGGAVSDLINGIATDLGPNVVAEFGPDILQIVMDKINEIIAKLL